MFHIIISPLRSSTQSDKIFLIYREIQMGSGAKSYMSKGFLIYEEMHKYIHHIWGLRRSSVIYDFATIPLNFLIYEKILFYFLSVWKRGQQVIA